MRWLFLHPLIFTVTSGWKLNAFLFNRVTRPEKPVPSVKIRDFSPDSSRQKEIQKPDKYSPPHTEYALRNGESPPKRPIKERETAAGPRFRPADCLSAANISEETET